ncbi:hypothetical protein LBWT_27530 [Leptolyngbya boryana IAM M-101]|nr:hypothetical protein LBWT_27530 [Leptolyngbya boryana IAM M-101]BAS63175.1 hypothetical protein LBDG_27530 [Leptolyngbya boryana dg5]
MTATSNTKIIGIAINDTRIDEIAIDERQFVVSSFGRMNFGGKMVLDGMILGGSRIVVITSAGIEIALLILAGIEIAKIFVESGFLDTTSAAF